MENRRSTFRELGEVFRFSLPIIVTMSSQALMQFVDALMIGHVGKNELAAVSPAGLTFFTFAAFMMGVVSCNNTFVSQSLGRDELDQCGRYTVHAIFIAWMAQALMLPLIINAPVIFSAYGHAPEVQQLEVSYFRALSFRLAGAGMIVSFSTFFQGTGRPHIPMITGLLANVFNIVGDYALIFGHFGFPAMGLLGAGIATTVGTCLEATLLLLLFLSPGRNALYGTRRWLPIEPRRIKQLLRIGIPSGITFGLDLASWTIFMAWAIGRLGTDVLAGNNAASQIMHMSFMPAVGLNIGITALVGKHIGKKDIPGAKRRAYLGMVCACGYMTVMGVMFFLFRRPLIGLFLAEPKPEIIAAGGISLGYIALFQFSDSIGILSAGALKGAGDTKYTAVVQVLTAWFFFLPLVFYLGRPEALGIHGAWLAATLYIWIYDILLFWRFVSERWRKIDIFQ
jgi:MATE family multidrug resistance protein